MESFSTGLLNQLEITSLFSHKKTARESQFRKHRGRHGVSTDTEVLEYCKVQQTINKSFLLKCWQNTNLKLTGELEKSFSLFQIEWYPQKWHSVFKDRRQQQQKLKVLEKNSKDHDESGGTVP